MVEVNRFSSTGEVDARTKLHELFVNSPIPEVERLRNLGLFINRQTLSRILFMQEMYQRIVNTHGIVTEFGTRWGQNLALFHSFRGMYEPYNMTRQIVAFDTFGGFVDIDAKDATYAEAKVGGMEVVSGYESYLEQVLACHEAESPLSHLRRFEIVKGDASKTFAAYLEDNPQTIVALAYFDMDVYKPTRDCLELLKTRVTKGSVIGFDELCVKEWAGETRAFTEVFPLDKYKIHRSPNSASSSYIVIE